MFRRKFPVATKGSPQVKGTAEKHGLFVLYPKSTDSAENLVADIIAIHGLGGDASSTWTDKDGHMWLRDSLPRNVPGARVMTFGYDSSVFWSHSTSGIADYARDLLERIRICRQTTQEKNRRIVFICHSLGGVVCKKALSIAYEQPHYVPILAQIHGIVFMGTPHRGSNLASWAKPLSNIMSFTVAGKRIRRDLLQNLEISSQVLAEISASSLHRLDELQITSFYEQNILEPLGCLVVEPFSAILGIANEKAIPMSADHRSMVRFSNSAKEKYRPVWTAVAEMVTASKAARPGRTQAEDNQLPRRLLKDLHCVDYSRYLVETPEPYDGTCTWIFSNPSFIEWATNPACDIFWIYGTPGNGKTVLVRHVVETLKSNTNVSGSLGRLRHSTVIHYFCLQQDKDRGSELTVLRSLLHQLLLAKPSISDIIRQYLDKSGKSTDMSTENLWKSLQEVLSMQILSPTVIILDALDELEDKNLQSFVKRLAQMLKTIKERDQGLCVKIFATSRPDWRISSSFEKFPPRELEIRAENIKSDLNTFIHGSVYEFGEANGFTHDLMQRIESEILNKAEGMFLWASLAWAEFKESVMIWTPGAVELRLQLLEQLPSGIEPLYAKLLSRINTRYLPELELLLGCIAAAARPLSSTEVAELLAIRDNQRNSSELDVAFSVTTVIKRTCPNLIKIDSSGIISFLHQSFKAYLPRSSLRLNLENLNRMLAQACLTYLDFDDLAALAAVDVERSVVKECLFADNFRLLDYVASHLLTHLSALSHEDDLWIKYSKLSRKPAVIYVSSRRDHSSHGQGTFRRSPITPLQNAIQLLNSTRLVERFVEQGYNINERYPLDGLYGYASWNRGGTALHNVINDFQWVSSLLKLGASPNERDHLSNSPLHLAIQIAELKIITSLLSTKDIDVNIKDISGQTPLHGAVLKRHGAVLEELLKDPRVDATIPDNNGRTPLTYAAYWGEESGVGQMLNSSRSFITSQDEGLLSPLICAAQHRWKGLTLEMILKVPDVNLHRGLDRKGIVHWASINEWDDVLRVAVEQAKAKPNQIDRLGKTALHYAGELGIPKIARQLVRYGASARIQDNNGRTAVHAAADAGFADVLNVLLHDSDFEVNEEDHQRRTVVHWAASCDWTSIMTTVLEQPDLEVRKTDCYGRTAAHIAALCGCPTVLNLLLDQDIFDINQTDGLGNSLLHLAARGGSLSIVETLLALRRRGFRIDHRNQWGQSALDVAALYHSDAVLDRLRDTGLRFCVAEDPVSVGIRNLRLVAEERERAQQQKQRDDDKARRMALVPVGR